MGVRGGSAQEVSVGERLGEREEWSYIGVEGLSIGRINVYVRS